MKISDMEVGMTIQSNYPKGNTCIILAIRRDDANSAHHCVKVRWNDGRDDFLISTEHFTLIASDNVKPLSLPDIQKNVMIDHSDYKFFAKVHSGCCACGITKSSCNYHR